MADFRIPPVYRRGAGVLQGVGQFARTLGQRALIVGGHTALSAVQSQVTLNLQGAGVDSVGVEWYGGECTWANIAQVSKLAVERKADMLIAVGGGKALDTGKAAAYQAGIPCVTVPTIAATCASFTPLSIIHDEHGVYVENTPLAACPAAVFVDTQVILDAPAKWLYAGMGDTLAKWYELRATTARIPRTSWTVGGIANGEICYAVIEGFGPGAKVAIEGHTISEELEYVIDAIVFYAGMSSILGGEKCRGAAAHSVYFGFTNIPEAHSIGHGLLVGFGNLVLLALEGRDDMEMQTEIRLARACGVPVQLSEIAELTADDLRTVAEVACNANDMKNMPMVVTPEMVVAAIERVDRLSRTAAC